MVFVHHGNQAVTKLHFNGLHRQQRIDVVDILVIIALAGRRGGLLRFCLSRAFRCSRFRRSLPLHTAADIITAGQQHAAAHGQRHSGRARDHGQKQQDDASGHNGPGLGGKLTDYIVVQAALRHRPRDDHASGSGNHQSRQLGNQTVADGGDGIGVQHSAKCAAVHHHADDHAAHKIDQRHNQRHHCVALDNFGGAVHSAIKIRFLLNFAPADTSLLLVDQTGRKVCVDSHLFTRHGVQGKASGHFSHALGAFGDNDKLHQHDDDKDDKTNHRVAACNQLTEIQNNRTGVAAVAQNLSGGRDVQPQSKQGSNQ